MRVLVLGGTGHIGIRVTKSLGRIPGAEVVSGTRSGGGTGSVVIDVRDPATFGVIDGFDFVINCTDTFTSPPDRLFEYCLRRPLTFLETTADPDAYLRMFDIAEAMPRSERRGALVPGNGIFPGLSNLLAAQTVGGDGPPRTLDLYISWSVLSGAGAGTCEVMVRSLSTPLRHYRNGRLECDRPLGAIVPTPFFRQSRWGLEIGLPESVLLGRSLGIPSISTFAATRPSVPRWVLSGTAGLAARGFFAPRPIQALLRFQFRLLRTRLLRNRSTSIEMVAVVNRDKTGPGDVRTRLKCRDAFESAAGAIAATVSLLCQRPREPGVQPPEAILNLDEVLAAMTSLGLDVPRTTDESLRS